MKHNVEIHSNAYDTQLFVPFRVEKDARAMVRLQACITEVRTWLSENHLKLMGQKQLINKIEGSKTICIGDSVVVCLFTN